jgi:hypothetical protein
MKLNVKYMASAALLVSTLAYAAPMTGSYTVYYSDAAHTVVVGEKIFSCNSNTYMDGEVTPYYTITPMPCGSEP